LKSATTETNVGPDPSQTPDDVFLSATSTQKHPTSAGFDAILSTTAITFPHSAPTLQSLINTSESQNLHNKKQKALEDTHSQPFSIPSSLVGDTGYIKPQIQNTKKPVRRRKMSDEEKQAWKARTDEVVKSYIQANDVFTKKLEDLRAKAIGNQEYLKSVDEMMNEATMRRQRIAIEGERIHAKVEQSYENSKVEKKHDVALGHLAACIKFDKTVGKDSTKRLVLWEA
jgi:hypothetical protein